LKRGGVNTVKTLKLNKGVHDPSPPYSSYRGTAPVYKLRIGYV